MCVFLQAFFPEIIPRHTLLLHLKPILFNRIVYRVRHKQVAPGVFGSFLCNGLKFKREILFAYVDNIFLHPGIN